MRRILRRLDSVAAQVVPPQFSVGPASSFGRPAAMNMKWPLTKGSAFYTTLTQETRQ